MSPERFIGDHASSRSAGSRRNGGIGASRHGLERPLAGFPLPLLPALLVLVLAGAMAACSGSGETVATPTAVTRSDGWWDMSQVRDRVSFDSLPFEEALGDPLETSIRKVDYALLTSLDATGLSHGSMELVRVDQVSDGDTSFHRQTLFLDLEGPAGNFLYELRQALSHACPDAWLRPVAHEEGHTPEVAPAALTPDPSRDMDHLSLPPGQAMWEIVTLGRTTHTLAINVPPDFRDSPNAMDWRLPEGVALMTIVIDDMGEDLRFTSSLGELGYPVVCSILPYTSHAVEVAELSHAQGLEVLLHQPMEPMDSHTNPGPTALYDDMDQRNVRDVFAGNMDAVPHAIGVNNHMGSRFTQNRNLVVPVVEEAFRRDWLILDSLTHPQSELADVAWEQGLPALKRDVFLDVVKDENAILFQLHKAARIALHNGRAVAIGHPYPETLAALRRFASERDSRVRIVPISQIAPGASPWLVDSSPVDSTAISR